MKKLKRHGLKKNKKFVTRPTLRVDFPTVLHALPRDSHGAREHSCYWELPPKPFAKREKQTGVNRGVKRGDRPVGGKDTHKMGEITATPNLRRWKKKEKNTEWTKKGGKKQKRKTQTTAWITEPPCIRVQSYNLGRHESKLSFW